MPNEEINRFLDYVDPPADDVHMLTIIFTSISIIICLFLIFTYKFTKFTKPTIMIMSHCLIIVFVRDFSILIGTLRYHFINQTSDICINDVFCQGQGMIYSYCNMLLFILISWQSITMGLRAVLGNKIEDTIYRNWPAVVFFGISLGIPVHSLLMFIGAFGDDRQKVLSGGCFMSQCDEVSQTEIFFFSLFANKLFEMLAYLAVFASLLMCLFRKYRSHRIEKFEQFLKIQHEFVIIYSIHMLHVCFRIVGTLRFFNAYKEICQIFCIEFGDGSLSVIKKIQTFTDASYGLINLIILLLFHWTYWKNLWKETVLLFEKIKKSK